MAAFVHTPVPLRASLTKYVLFVGRRRAGWFAAIALAVGASVVSWHGGLGVSANRSQRTCCAAGPCPSSFYIVCVC